MRDLLVGARAKLYEHFKPFLDENALDAAGIDVDGLTQKAAVAVAAELSYQFILTPRAELSAAIRECEADPEITSAVADRIVLMRMAIAKARCP